MTKINLLLIFTFLTAFAVISQNEVLIKVKLLNNTEHKVAYFENIVEKIILDSAIVESSGVFNLNAKILKPDFYKLRFSDEHYVLMVINPGEQIEIEIDALNMFIPKITGSAGSEAVYNTYAKMKDFDIELQVLSKQTENKKKEYLRQFVLNNLTSLSSLFFIENLSIDEDLAVYEKLDASLTKLFPGHPLVKNLHDRVKALTQLSIGSEAPEIDLPDLKGKNIKLSSLRGRYVLIDFWAAWCGPCRKESPNMVALYKEYKKKGFEIYSVSLDSNKKDWEAAIKKDGLGDWTHVSDLKYWSSAAAQAYGVDGIPYTVLIDKAGKIIGKGLRGEELKNKMKEIFPPELEKK